MQTLENHSYTKSLRTKKTDLSFQEGVIILKFIFVHTIMQNYPFKKYRWVFYMGIEDAFKIH